MKLTHLSESTYKAMKGRCYEIFCLASGHDNTSAKHKGFKDVYDLVMSDTDSPIYFQWSMLHGNVKPVPESLNPAFMNSLVREYRGFDTFSDFVEWSCSGEDAYEPTKKQWRNK